MEETRVGNMATAVLEEVCRDYIGSFTVDGKFVGEVKYLIIHESLRKYNQPSSKELSQ
jgi:hypothetical protein